MEHEPLFFQDEKSANWLDEKLFNELFNRYWKKLFGFCRHHLADAEISKEIVQQVYLSLWERRSQLDIQVNLGHYLFSAARLCIAKHFRDSDYRKKKLICNNSAFCESTNSTEEAIHFEDLNRYIDSLLDKLPCRCREVYKMSRKGGLSIPEIAEELDISIKTAEAHLTKALKYLRAEIQASEA